MSKDLVHVSCPYIPNNLNFFDLVPSGRKPRPTVCNGPEYATSFNFRFGEFYELKRTVEKRIGKFTRWDAWGRVDYNKMQSEFMKAIGPVFESKGFKGEATWTGLAIRGNKKAWSAKATGCNFLIQENFILAKLMGQELFEELIWDRAVKAHYPNTDFALGK